MKREHTIPLFLWIALALCVHAITGGGANRASEWFAERLDVRDFARDARGLARRAATEQCHQHKRQRDAKRTKGRAWVRHDRYLQGNLACCCR